MLTTHSDPKKIYPQVIFNVFFILTKQIIYVSDDAIKSGRGSLDAPAHVLL